METASERQTYFSKVTQLGAEPDFKAPVLTTVPGGSLRRLQAVSIDTLSPQGWLRGHLS